MLKVFLEKQEIFLILFLNSEFLKDDKAFVQIKVLTLYFNKRPICNGRKEIGDFSHPVVMVSVILVD